MRKNLFFLFVLLSLGSLITVRAQSGCELYINTDFDSECLITDYLKRNHIPWELGLQDCMLACKGNTVKYTAVCSNASQYSWVIAGASNYYFINQGKTAVVTWDYGMTGNISVSVVVGDTNTCTAEACVLLMDSPDANSSSVPSFYYNQDGEKVIEICTGETIEFTDMSSAAQTPITGYYWESEFGAASTQNYTLTPFDEGEFILTHCVRNECGCENCETYIIKVKAKVELELSCYGTVCEHTTANYTLINPPCSEYIWNVEGGSLEGQGTPNITVHWGSPASGYGVISLDASKCKTECDGLLSIQIPVITSNAEISGPEVVCVGEMQIYELPRWGSTEYTWWNNNSTCLIIHNSETPNQYMLEFTQPGIVTIGANYICRFLNCDYLVSAPKTIVVKDTMSILSDDNTLCKGSTGTFHTTHTNSVQWTVYDENNQQIYSTNAVTLSYTFTSAGNFKITASHNDYCKVVEYYVTVLDNPPTLTSTTGAHVACPNSSILLKATPTHPRYYIVWEPVCSSANPTSAEGNEVTITYGNEVCDVAVYQVDNEYNCRSGAYIHEVDTFHLLPHGLPAITTACAGSTVCFNVPDQSPDVTYEWTINPANAASIDSSDHLRPSICILTNHLNVTPPYWVDVTLKRTYCSDLKVNETVRLLIEDVAAPALNCPDTVCEKDLETLTAIGNTQVASHYTWFFSDTSQIFHGTTVTRRFNTLGYVYVTVTYQPNPNCDPVVVNDTIWVNSIPYANITKNGNNFQVQSYANVNYVWSYNGSTVDNVTTNTCPSMGNGVYCCTITSTVSPYCSDSDCYTLSPGTEDTCVHVTTATVNRICNDVTVSVTSHLGPQYSWSLSTYQHGSYCSPTQSSNSTIAHFNVVGDHYVYAHAVVNGQCYTGEEPVQVDCVPAISLSYDCYGHIVVKDISQYRNGYTIPNRTVTVAGTNLTATIYSPQMSVSIPTATLQAGTYTISMSVGSTGCVCSKEITLEPNPTITSIDIPANMCSSTPFLFTATTTGTIVKYEWDFGDNSSNEGDSIYHTYAREHTQHTCVHLVVTNSLGCSAVKDSCITVISNVLDPRSLEPISSTQVCPGTARAISFYSFAPNTLYIWSPASLTTDNSLNNCNVYQTGDYYVTAIDSNYGCRAKAMCNVGFLTAPWARIIGNTEYCLGETVELNGNTGSNNTYAWSVSGPSTPPYTSANANLTYVPTQPGTYTVTLTVSNQSQCNATASCTFTVYPQPVAPTIAINGTPCIHEPPIEIQSTSGQSLLWSNGYHGTSAYTYSDGYIRAHYIDPSTGCKSKDAEIFIEPAPDFDALLTGCYTMCRDQFQYDLPIYGLYPYQSGSLNWDWVYHPTNSHFTVVGLNPTLPLIGFGNYYMNATYAPGCTVKSPELVIEQENLCPCDSVSFKPNGVECKVSGCKFFYTFYYTICNNGSQYLNFDDLQASFGGTITYASPLPLIIAPGDCEDITFEIQFTDFMSSTFEFALVDHSRNCEVSYVENVDWQSCINEQCDIFDIGYEFNLEVSTAHESSYYQFGFNAANAVDVLSVWSKPSQVINYTTNGSYPVNVNGLLMLDYGLLSQMAMNGQEICFYVIACVDGENLCYDSICVPADAFLEQLPEEFRQLPDSTTADNDSTRSFQSSSIIPQVGKPYLAPNPARDEVTVMGIAPEEVAEITVLTMQGGQVADFRNDYRFNVSRLAKASYIVRVVTTDKQVYYLKLVKQ